MLIGGQLRAVEDVGFLKSLCLDLGEFSFRNSKSREYWIESGISSGPALGLLLRAHGPEEGPPNDPANLWDRYLPELMASVDACIPLAIDFITVHLWVDPRFVRQEVIQEKIRALAGLVAYAKDRGVKIALENLSEKASDFEPVVREIPDLAITLDVGHGQLLADKNTSYDIIAGLFHFVQHVHLHDNRGGNGVRDDLHLPVGDGVVDFQGILETLVAKGYDGTFTLELKKEELPASVEKVRSLLRDIERRRRD